MKNELELDIRVLHIQEKMTKDGKPYLVYIVLIQIGKADFIRELTVFPKP